MKYYPIYLDVKDKPCLIVGGGSVGARKAFCLVKCGAKVKIVSKAFSKAFEGDIPSEMVLETKRYEKSDLENIFLVFAATNDAQLNRRVSNDSKARNILCNIADSKSLSDFILPSVVDKGNLILTVSTSGKSPAMAKKIRRDLEKQFGKEYERFLFLMGRIREELFKKEHAPEKHHKIFNTLIEKELLTFVAKNDERTINRILEEVLGSDYTYQRLVSQE
ncbi:MAG: bifunctional precorrin-2 dehydrogenase/sirohydrochlorin ferrochelatase [Desulfobacteraceae bacterium]|nr:bifunctional precorrin-2 dehydrogenase/sirohydrochlorin ferrochelatase [Desulfobacteraceae bacterium]